MGHLVPPEVGLPQRRYLNWSVQEETFPPKNNGVKHKKKGGELTWRFDTENNKKKKKSEEVLFISKVLFISDS